MSGQQPLSIPAGTSYLTTTPSQCHDSPLTLGSLHGLVQSALNTSDGHSAQCDGASGESVHVGGVAPNTPQRAVQHNTVTPLTPLANLKVLMAAAAASSALEGKEGGGRAGERVVKVEEGGGEGGEEGNTAPGRKLRSLALLCKRFLSIVESDVGTGNEFSLDMMAQNLGTNRRRIYDIINVLEAVEMIVKQSKNWYSWSGRGGLLITLAKLKAMAGDDPELVKWFRTDFSNSKENIAPPNVSVARQQCQSLVARQQSQTLVAMDETSQDSISDDTTCDDGQTKGGRWDKSLGILCQKFIMLFLLAPNHELTLDLAGNILIPDDDYPAISAPTHPKTKVRRLYDIANVLTTLELIKKKTFLAVNQRKMPGYVWCGPSVTEIESVPVCRKREFPSSAGYSRKPKGTALERKSSFGGRPFLHQYEVKDSSSAPSTPCKTVPTNKPLRGWPVGGNRGGGGGSIRRSLSFGGQSSARMCGGCGQGKKMGETRNESCSASAAAVRPLVPKAVDYLNEMKEFENEMKKHSHRYPHVLTIFQDFIHRYQISLEQAVISGRSILPKPPSPPSLPLLLHPLTNLPDPLGFSTPQNSTNPSKNQRTVEISPTVTDLTCNDGPALNYKELEPLQDDSGFQSGNSLLGGALMTSSSDIVSVSKLEMKTATQLGSEAKKCALKNSNSDDVTDNPTPSGETPSLSVLQSHHKQQTVSEPLTMQAVFTHALSSTPLATSLPLSLQPAPPPSLTPRETDSQQALPTNGSLYCTTGSRSGAVSNSHPLQISAASSSTQNCSSNEIRQCAIGNSLPDHCDKPSSGLEHRATDSSSFSLPVSGFTQGTLQSPEKPFHAKSRAFVRVEDFLSALTAQSGHTLADPRLAATATSLPTGVQPFSPSSLLSHLLTSTQGAGISNAVMKVVATGSGENSPRVCPPAPLNPSQLVNQKPISATSEAEGKKSLKQPTHGTGNIKPFSNTLSPPPIAQSFAVPPHFPLSDVFMNPNTLLQTPARFLAPQTILPNTTPGFVPLAPRIYLPSFQAACVPSPASVPLSTSHTELYLAPTITPSDDESAPKRAKLE